MIKRKFTKEFKLQIVNEFLNGSKTQLEITREYNLSDGIVSKWVSEYRKEGENAFPGSRFNKRSENDELRGKIKELEALVGRKTMEIEVLSETVRRLRERGNVKNPFFTK